MIRLLLVLLVFLLSSEELQASEPLDVHILAIGNGHYGASPDADAPDPVGMPFSARLAADELKEIFGSTSETLLLSDDENIITKADVLTVIDRVLAKAEASPSDDFIILYYGGHGFGEGFGWNYFLQPGDVRFPKGQIDTADVEVLAEQLIYGAELVHKLKASGARFLVLFDTCYEGTERQISSSVLSEQALTTISQVAEGLRAFNDFRGQANPVVFSAEPGTTVITVDIGDFYPVSSRSVGPLARRLALARRSSNDLSQTGESRQLTLSSLVHTLTNEKGDRERGYPGLTDPETEPGVSKADTEAIIFDSARRAQTSEILMGSAVPSAIREFDLNLTLKNDGPVRAYDIRFATMALLGTEDDFITNGEDWVFVSPEDTFELENYSDTELSFWISGPSGDWFASFTAEKGSTLWSQTADKVMHSQSDETGPRMEIWGDSRACIEPHGAFKATGIAREGNLHSFVLDFAQVCDGTGDGLRGSLTMEIETPRTDP